MASVWFRCPICGFQMQGDPRFPPPCPNTANHPQAFPGQPLQPVVILPPRPLSWRERYRAYNRRRQIRGLKALGILFLIGLVCIVVLIPVYFILSIIDPARPGAPSLITEATFGGTVAAFQTKYGDPQPSDITTTTKVWKVTINGLHVLVSVTPAAEEANDGHDHISVLSIGPDGGTWSQSTADQILPTFLPGDATYQKDEQVPGVGLARVYLSPDLGETFATSDFVDSEGNSITPGTFMASFNTSLKGAYVLKLGA